MKAKQATQQQMEQARRMALVDELGGLEQRLAPYGALNKRAAAIRAEIRGWAEEQPGEVAINYQGAQYVAQASARAMERKPVMARVFAKLGKEKFLAACSMAIQTIEDLLPLAERAGLLVESRSGWRRVTVAPLEAVEALLQAQRAG